MIHPSQEMLLGYLRSHTGEFVSVGQHAEDCTQCLGELERLSEFDLTAWLLESTGSEADTCDVSELQSKCGRYEFLERIGSGGMAEVFRCYDQHLKREVAVKVIRRSLTPNPQALARFKMETHICAGLQHHGTAVIHDRGELVDGRPFFVMRLVEGKTFKQVLRESKAADGVGALLQIFQNVCQTVAYAHRLGVVHRDLKPENILIGGFGEVRVMDWGIAGCTTGAASVSQMIGSSSAHKSGIDLKYQMDGIVGTPNYMSPEQAIGGEDTLNPKMDVFALGVILFEIVCRAPLYPVGLRITDVKGRGAAVASAHDRMLELGVDDQLIRLVDSCLARDLQERPENAHKVADSMADYFATQQQRFRQAEISTARAEAEVVHERKRQKLLLALAVMVISLAMTLSVAFLVHFKQQVQLDRQFSARLGPFVERASLLMQKHADLAELDNQVFEQICGLIQSADEVAAESSDAGCKVDYLRVRAEFESFEPRARAMLGFDGEVEKFFAAIRFADQIQDGKQFRRPRKYGLAPLKIYDFAFGQIGITERESSAEILKRLGRFRESRKQELVLALHRWALLKLYCRENPKWQIELAKSFDPDRASLWNWRESGMRRLIEFAQSSRAIDDPFTALLTFELLIRGKKRVIARRLLERAVEQHPGNFRIPWKLALHARAQANRRGEKSALVKTAIYFSRCATNCPRHQDAQLKYSRTLAELGQHEMSARVLIHAARKWPEDSRIFSNLAIQQLEIGEHELALENGCNACLAASLGPESGTSYSIENLEACIEECGRAGGLSKLVEIVRANAVDHDRNRRQAFKALAKVLAEIEDFDSAEYILGLLTPFDHAFDVEAAKTLAICSLKQGDTEGEIKWLTLAADQCKILRHRENLLQEIEFAKMRLEYESMSQVSSTKTSDAKAY